MSSYRDLKVWQEAIDLAVLCWGATADFPSEERYVLAAQIRRAAASVPANIAEGEGRSARVFLNHLSIAYGSVREVESHTLLAERLGYVDGPHLNRLLDKTTAIAKMLHKLRASLRQP